MVSARYFVNQDIACFSAADDIIIITENADGEEYILVANTIHTVLDDWENECEYVPANDAPVHFSMMHGMILSHEYRTFEMLMDYFLLLRHEDC